MMLDTHRWDAPKTHKSHKIKQKETYAVPTYIYLTHPAPFSFTFPCMIVSDGLFYTYIHVDQFRFSVCVIMLVNMILISTSGVVGFVR